MANEQINVPSLVVILVLSGLIIRYLFFSSPAPGQSGQQPRDPAAAVRSREAAVERIQQMFPQVDRRTLLWELQRNGGSITATTERILAGRIDTPPITFQPPPPPAAPGAAPGASGSTAQAQNAAARPPEKPAQPDLITRYHLQDKLAASTSDDESAEGGAPARGKAWSSNREERQSLLQKRRDHMILEARRKMEAKIAAERAAGAAEIEGGL